MTTNVEEQELKDRLSLIETMIAEGRQSTESWGWTFVLWGVAYYVAIAWANWGHSNFAWPVTMIATSILTWVVASRMGDKQPETTVGRAIGAIWIGVGCSMFLLFMSAGISGRMDQQTFIAVVAAMLGSANAASGVLLRWKAQFACALVWCTTAVLSCFGTPNQSAILGLVAIFLCQIVFGSYMMFSEFRERKAQGRKSGALHA
jgi:fatty acid desaturase